MATGPVDGIAPYSREQKLDLAILWCRRDLRVTDNPALNAALLLAKQVVRFYLHFAGISMDSVMFF